jgi:signal transduction histidine kinase
LSKELHDNVNQLLATANLFLSSEQLAQKNKDEESCTAKAKHYIREALEEIRKISKSLNTSIVEQTGLFDSINEILTNLNLGQNIITGLELEHSTEKQMSSALRLMIYRIVQEQTNNIIKYAKATRVSVSIKKKEDTLYLLISDNGKGFDPKQLRKGIGLVNIRNRVEAFNGKLHIHSVPGNGCSLEIAIPFKEKC